MPASGSGVLASRPSVQPRTAPSQSSVYQRFPSQKLSYLDKTRHSAVVWQPAKQILIRLLGSKGRRPVRREEEVAVGRFRHRAVAIAAVGAACSLSLGAAAALAADASAPVLGVAAFSSPPDGNNGWRIHEGLNARAGRDDRVAVAKLQYSVDGGLTYIDAPITPGASVSASIPLSSRATPRSATARQLGQRLARREQANTTLNQPAAAGATAIRLQSTASRGTGDELSSTPARRERR